MLFSAVVRLLVPGAGVCERTSHRTKLKAVALYGRLFGVLAPFLPRGCVSEVALHGCGHESVLALACSSFLTSPVHYSCPCQVVFVSHHAVGQLLSSIMNHYCRSLSNIIPDYIPSVVDYTLYPHCGWLCTYCLLAIISNFKHSLAIIIS